MAPRFVPVVDPVGDGVHPRDARTSECKEGYEQCYDWDHIVEADKECAIGNIQVDNRCLATCQPEIDEERAKCRLLCKNCHNTRSQWDV